MNIGDKVRFLSEVGGGVVKGFQSKDIVLVEDEDGFEIPMQMRECVVIETDNYNVPLKSAPKKEEVKEETVVSKKELKIERPTFSVYKQPETKQGNVLNLFLAFVPTDVKMLSNCNFDTYLVNDSNYYLYFTYAAVGDFQNNIITHGVVEPNTKLLVEELPRTLLNAREKVQIQAVAFKDGKDYAAKSPVNVTLKIDTVKFFKLHSFKTNEFFAEPTLLYEVVKDDAEYQEMTIDPSEVKQAIWMKENAEKKSKSKSTSNFPNKNGIVEVDLHIDELLDDTTGMSNADMLNYQLDKFHEVMKQYKNKREQRIVFIHGKGDGVLRKAVLDELKKKYGNCRWQDASFKEYGYGATMVTIK